MFLGVSVTTKEFGLVLSRDFSRDSHAISAFSLVGQLNQSHLSSSLKPLAPSPVSGSLVHKLRKSLHWGRGGCRSGHPSWSYCHLGLSVQALGYFCSFPCPCLYLPVSTLPVESGLQLILFHGCSVFSAYTHPGFCCFMGQWPLFLFTVAHSCISSIHGWSTIGADMTCLSMLKNK